MKRFPDYVEEEINFWPTYKRGPFQNGHYINKKEQCPSYTDRILFKNNTNYKTAAKNYFCYEEVFGSDHRPVGLDLVVSI